MMDTRQNTKTTDLISARGTTKTPAALSTSTAIVPKSLVSSSINDFTQLPKHILDDKRLQNFQKDLHQKIIG